jgi:dTDP-4-dehydrorhamnose 3,5-epimerase
MEVISLKIPAVKIFKPKKFGDHRGFFSETYNKKTMSELGVNLDFIQDNHSLSADVGTLRGLHFQTEPFAQDKLVRVVRGKILDVAVDLRNGSPTYGEHVSAEVSATEWNQILVPVGFAHGFITLEPDTEVIYKVTNFYAPDCDKGVAWNDPDLHIDWGISEDEVILSDKDKMQPAFKDLDLYFTYQ